jgi:hypothetical protein
MCQTGSPDVVTASISPSFAISSVKSTPVLPALLAPFTDIYDFKFLNKSGSTPERLAMMTAELPPFSTTQTLRLLVSNDASSPSYWSSVWQRESDPNGWFSTPSFGMAANGSRFITASHHQVFADVEYLYDARVVTGATDTTVGIKKLPAITGSLKVGATLTVSAPTFVGLPAGASLSFEWLRDGESVSTGRSYALTQEDAGTTLSVTVTATADTSYPIAVSSVTTATVKGGVLTVPTVTISGTAAVGSELQAQTSGSFTAGMSVSYTWKRGARVVGNLSSYIASSADVGKSLTLTARFSRNGFTAKTVTVTSAVVVAAD